MNITIESTIHTTSQTAWKAFTTPESITQWNFASEDWQCPRAELDLRPGGKFNYRMEAKDGSMGFDFEGKFTAITPNRLIEFSLGDQRKVSVEFLPEGDDTRVIETFEAEDQNSAELQRQGWQSILNNFKKFVETSNPQPSPITTDHTMNTQTQCKPVGWFEIYVGDMSRARAFYEATLNIKLEPLPYSGEDEMEMWMFPDAMDQSKPGSSGALCKMEGCQPGGGGTIIYFMCEDCAVEAGRATAHGGRVYKEKMSIGEYGFIAIIGDSEGNTIGLHSMK